MLIVKLKTIAKLSGVSQASMNQILKKLRGRIAEFCETESPFESRNVKVDDPDELGETKETGLIKKTRC